MITTLLFLTIICWMGLMSRLAGSGFGERWGTPWLPELLFCLPIALAGGYVWGATLLMSVVVTVAGLVVSYAGMQSGTWMFLRWESHDDPNTKRSSTLKPVIDAISKVFGYKLGDEGYAWIAAALKGFIISLPLGGIGLFAWPLGYEIGSHAKGRVGFDPHIVSEAAAGVLMGMCVCVFLYVFGVGDV